MRFEFGKNWESFSLHSLNASTIIQAREGLNRLVPLEALHGKRFLDIGFGQGLPLLLSAQAGASSIGIDIDPKNIDALRNTAVHFPSIPVPLARTASILDPAAVAELAAEGPFDIVHSWGVLHHTGEMYPAIENALSLVKPGGLFIVSIYAAHWSSPAWRAIKRAYNVLPEFGRKAMVAMFYPIIFFAKFAVTRKNPLKKERGMDFYHDVVDWLGGYPYEYAHPDEIRRFVQNRGFREVRFFACSVPTGCNEFVFRRQ